MTTVLRLADRALDEAVIVVPTGQLDIISYRQLRDHLLKVGTDTPRAIVVDLSGLEIRSGSSLAIFAAVQTRLEQWPGVQLMLVSGAGPARTLLARNLTSRFLPVHENVSDAVAAIDDVPPRRVAHLRLPSSLISPRVAREFTRLTCLGWGLGDLLDDVLLLVGELVTNAVVHTESAPLLRLEVRRDLFSAAVYDDLECEVTLRDPGAGAGIHGLLLVTQIATMWGASPTLTGGKVVWATLRTR